jgi:hypothetical protein
VSDPELIAAAVEASGLSARRFAERVLSRDERTVRRWTAGDVPIPPLARAWLAWFVALSEPKRRRLVALLTA